MNAPPSLVCLLCLLKVLFQSPRALTRVGLLSVTHLAVAHGSQQLHCFLGTPSREFHLPCSPEPLGTSPFAQFSFYLLKFHRGSLQSRCTARAPQPTWLPGSEIQLAVLRCAGEPLGWAALAVMLPYLYARCRSPVPCVLKTACRQTTQCTAQECAFHI